MERFFKKIGVDKTRNALWIILALSLLVYANSLFNAFVWDDFIVIVNNDFVKSAHNFKRIVDSTYLTKLPELGYFKDQGSIGAGEISYRPVVTLTYFIDYHFWKLNPFGYHLTNVALHALNCMLLYLFLRLLLKNNLVSFLTALLFAIHPAATEAVDVVSFREDLLVMFFVLIAMIGFLESYANLLRKAVSWFIVSCAALFLALFSKESALVVPLYFLGIEFLFLRRQGKPRFSAHRYAGFAGVTVFYVWVRFFFMKGGAARVAPAMTDWVTKVSTMAVTFLQYVQWLVFPVNLRPTLPDDPRLIQHSLFSPAVIFSGVLMCVLVAAALRLRRRMPLYAFGFFWFLTGLIPVSNIAFPITNYCASRYLYMPLAGFCLVLALVLLDLPSFRIFSFQQKTLKKISGYAIVLLLLFYSTFTMIRNIAWRHDIALWLEMVEYYPQSAIAHSGLGRALRNKKNINQAIEHFRIALRLDPSNAFNHNWLGLCLDEEGRLDEAIAEFDKALELQPRLAPVYVNRGVARGRKGLNHEAMDDFNEALRREPRFYPAYYNLGILFTRLKQRDKAKESWGMVLEISPNNKEAKERLREFESAGK